MADASNIFLSLKHAFEGWMFPVFVRRFALPKVWPAPTLSIGLGPDKGMWESRVVRDDEFADVITELKSSSKAVLYMLGALMLIGSPFAMFENPILAFGIIPSYLMIGIPVRMSGSFAHGSAVKRARAMFRRK